MLVTDFSLLAKRFTPTAHALRLRNTIILLKDNGPFDKLPFGGVQILLVGDLFQLPPVTKQEGAILNKRGYESPYFFSAKTLKHCPMCPVELTEIFRQRDPEFANMLNQIRVAENLEEVIPKINASTTPVEGGDPAITLTCTNAVAEEINSNEQNKLSGDNKTYLGQVNGKVVMFFSLKIRIVQEIVQRKKSITPIP